MYGSDWGCKLSIAWALALRSREQLIKKHKEDPKFGNLNWYLLDTNEIVTLIAAIFEKWCPQFNLILIILF